MRTNLCCNPVFNGINSRANVRNSNGSFGEKQRKGCSKKLPVGKKAVRNLSLSGPKTVESNQKNCLINNGWRKDAFERRLVVFVKRTCQVVKQDGSTRCRTGNTWCLAVWRTNVTGPADSTVKFLKNAAAFRPDWKSSKPVSGELHSCTLKTVFCWFCVAPLALPDDRVGAGRCVEQ